MTFIIIWPFNFETGKSVTSVIQNFYLRQMNEVNGGDSVRSMCVCLFVCLCVCVCAADR